MSDSSSGRNKFNAGSDSQRHYQGGTAHDAYQRTPAPGKSTPVTNRHPGGAVGNTKADSTTAPPASGNVLPHDFEE